MIVELLETKEDSVVLKIGTDVVSMDKKEFEKNFALLSDNKYDMVPEYEAMIKERVKDIEDILPDLLLAKNHNPVGMMRLAEKTHAYCEKWDTDMVSAMKEIGKIYKRFLAQSVNAGISFNEKVYDLPEKLKKKNRENSKAFKKEEKKEYKKGPTLGELNPGLEALKNKLKTIH